jgi:hypothetical protein
MYIRQKRALTVEVFCTDDALAVWADLAGSFPPVVGWPDCTMKIKF